MAYGARLESVLGASPRGFESPILRHENGPVTCGDAREAPFGRPGWVAACNNRLQLRLQLQRACVVTERGRSGAGATRVAGRVR